MPGGHIVHHRPSTCASAASAWGSQNVISMAQYSSIAVVSAVQACSCWPLAYSVPQAVMAVGLEWAHAQLFGQGEGLAVVAGSGFALWGRLACRALAQEPQGPGLVAAVLALAGEIESLHGVMARLLQAASHQIRLAEVDDCRYQFLGRPLVTALLHPVCRQRRPAATRPSRAYARPRAAASSGNKSRMCQSWHSAMPRSSTGSARWTSP